MSQKRSKRFIGTSQTGRLDILFVILLGAFLGLVTLRLSPLFSENIPFLFALPFALIFFLLMLFNIRAALVILLFSRVLLDPVFNLTKVNIFGEAIGIGGSLNFFIIIVAIYLIIRNRQSISECPLKKQWAFFLFICAVAISYTPLFVRGGAIRLFLNLLSYACMFLMPFFVIKNGSEEKFFIKILLLSSLLPVIVANAELLMGGASYGEDGIRIQGTFTHPNILGFYLILMIALVFYIFKCNLFSLSKTKKNMLIIYMFDLFLLLIFTKTRSAWISCWSLFFLYGLLKEKRYLVLSTIAVFLLIFVPVAFERIRDVFERVSYRPGQGLNSFVWRLELWRGSLAWIREKVVFGRGLASFEYFSKSFAPSRGGCGPRS